ncbi:hypothetical protein D043_4214B, partial [Vibrio parahaemolyticus EKP-021]
NNGANVERLFP